MEKATVVSCQVVSMPFLTGVWPTFFLAVAISNLHVNYSCREKEDCGMIIPGNALVKELLVLPEYWIESDGFSGVCKLNIEENQPPNKYWPFFVICCFFAKNQVQCPFPLS
ncbi:hypothetical protein [Filimonas lacunae]|nr:hypothetical protein [Filimonas lacunae]